jgi:ABC-2 type transport system ATP-binding protein
MESGNVMGSAMIHVENLVKCYGQTRAVDRLSFDVGDGEIVGLLGPNGAGKTTTMRVLSCYLPPTSGVVEVAGHNVVGASVAVRAAVGYLAEQVPLYAEMRVSEYLRFRGQLRGISGTRLGVRLGAVTELCDIADCLRAPIRNLSKGYRQRVGLADSLLHDPQVLILDEPTIGLDPQQVRQFRQLVRGVSSAHSVLVSSHILSEVEQLCSRVVVVHDGHLVGSGTPAELIADLGGAVQVVADIFAPRRELLRGMAAVPGIESVRCEPHGGWSKVHVACGDPAAVCEAIYEMVASRKWRLRELHGDTRTLEDAYVRLISRGDEQ